MSRKEGLDLKRVVLLGRTLEEYRALLAAEQYELMEASPLASARGASLLTARAKAST